MNPERDEPTIHELIERSSLGTPEAKAARESVDPELARKVVQAAHADMPVTCQGCGAVRYGLRWLDQPHACHRNEDGSYEEGGTFQ